MKSSNNLGISIFVLFAIVFVQFASPQPARAACDGIIYVDADSTAVSPTGCSWAFAYTTLQDALNDPLLESDDQIWVAEGTYYPDEGTGQTDNNRNSTFRLLDGISIYGGFNGNEALLEDRDENPSTNGTVLSGDIGTLGVYSDNAYHVVTATTIVRPTVLDGFTITKGYATGVETFGGGFFMVNSSPTLANLLIIDNHSPVGSGGGIFLSTNPGHTASSPLLTNVTFNLNIAEKGGGLLSQNSNPVLTNVTFSNNQATNGAGGGMSTQTAQVVDAPAYPVLTNVTFSGNTATGGGGMINSNSHTVLTNVTFSGNTANRRGGGMLNEFSNPTLTNVTFFGNVSNESMGGVPWGGGGMMNVTSNPILNHVTFSGNNSVNVGGDAIRNAVNSSPVITNSIFWGDTNDEINSDGTGTTTISYSVVQGGFAGGSNIVTTDPKLKTLANNGGFTQTMALGADSSAINAGNNALCATSDQRGVTRPQGTVCDIGAYEFDGVTTLTVSPVTDTYGNTVNLTATLISNGTGLSGKTVNFTLNGSNAGSAVTNGSGIATLNSISLVGINAGTYPGGAGSGVGASFAGDSIFLASSDSDTLTINKRPITVTAINDTKEYDGTTTSTKVPTITSGSLAGSDTATWTQSFDTKTVEVGKTLTPTGSVSDGNGGNNYDVAFVNVTGSITARGLTVSGITAGNKTYNGNATATLNVAGAVLNGVVGTENVTLNTGSAAGAFDSKNVGIGKTVTVSGLTLGGTDSGNYSLATPTATANITRRSLTVTVTGVDKVYDGTVTATIGLLDDRIVGDILTITYNTAAFLDPNVGDGKTVNVSGISISGGTDDGNYLLGNTSANTTANITPAGQTITITTHAPFSAVNGSNFTVAATATSGLSVTYSSATPGICTNIGAAFTMISGTGACTVQYNQAGNANYLPAPELTENIIATEAPAITSADTTTFNVGELGAFTVTSFGNPTPSLSLTGLLPTGVTFNPVTGLLGGTPSLGTNGTYNIVFTASNGVGTDATQNFTLIVTSLAKINVSIGGSPMGSYTLASGAEKRDDYPVSGGPVKVESTNAIDIVSAIRLQSFANNTLYSFVETMGVPSGLLSHKYYFPTYNNTWAPLNSQVRFGNLDAAQTRIRVTIGGVNVWEQDVPGLAERRLTFNVSGGPVVIESLDPAKKIVAAIRLQSFDIPSNTLYSFSETMGIPDQVLSHEYYFPTYNNTWAPLNSQVRFGNLDAAQTRIRVTIGGVNVWEEDVPGLAERRLNFNVSGGPVKVESLDPTKKIVAAIRLQSFTNDTLYSFVETMGVPGGLLSHKYVFPTYNNTWVPLNSQVRFGNLDAAQTRIRVTIGGVNVWEEDVPGLAERRLYFNVSGGPVVIESLDPTKKIVAAIRLQSSDPVPGTLYSFSETMGIPSEYLSDIYYFPTYNNTWAPLNSQLRFGVP